MWSAFPYFMPSAHPLFADFPRQFRSHWEIFFMPAAHYYQQERRMMTNKM
jgi:hypothetical protein